jgi:hypothetical protein
MSESAQEEADSLINELEAVGDQQDPRPLDNPQLWGNYAVGVARPAPLNSGMCAQGVACLLHEQNHRYRMRYFDCSMSPLSACVSHLRSRIHQHGPLAGVGSVSALQLLQLLCVLDSIVCPALELQTGRASVNSMAVTVATHLLACRSTLLCCLPCWHLQLLVAGSVAALGELCLLPRACSSQCCSLGL